MLRHIFHHVKNMDLHLPSPSVSPKIRQHLTKFIMSRVCQLTGARPKSGHNVSHSNRKTKRRFLPNLITKRIFDPVTGTFVRIKMTARALRTMAKNPKKYAEQVTALAKKAQKKALKNKSK